MPSESVAPGKNSGLLVDIHVDKTPAPEVVLILHPDHNIRGVIRSNIEALLPGWGVEVVGGVGEIREGMKGRVALIIAKLDLESGVGMLDVEIIGAAIDGVPLLVTADGELDRSQTNTVAQYRKPGWVNGMITMQDLDSDNGDDNGLGRVMSSALFSKLKGVDALKRRRVKEFIEIGSNLLAGWKEKIGAINWENLGIEDEDLRENGKKDFVECLRVIEDRLNQLDKIIDEGEPENLNGQLSEPIHAIINKLSALITGAEDLAETPLGDVFLEFLGVMREFLAHVKEISKIYKSRPEGIYFRKSPLKEEEGMEAFKGLKILVIDDNPLVLRAAKSKLGGWGAHVSTSTPGELDGILVSANQFDMVLLDNDLGRDASGNQILGSAFIGRVRSVFPDAVVLGHTGAAEELNMQEKNPYKDAGITVLGKMDFAAISAAFKNAKGLTD